jgi:hypothetical protein
MRIWNMMCSHRDSVLARAAANREIKRRQALLVRRAGVPSPYDGIGFSEIYERFLERMYLLQRMDGGYYRDTRSPFTGADVTAVTLATTDKALWPVANIPPLGSNYFGFIGKKLAITAFGRITTVLTPGNGTLDVYWGTGADANGTIVQSSAAHALTASQTNLSWILQLLVTCRAQGASGALLCTGHLHY